MNKRLVIYIVIFVLLVVGILYIESSKQKPINWFPSYATKHKIPYGTYILKQELSSLFKNSIKEIHQSPFEFLRDSTKKGTYFFLDDRVRFDKAEFNKLLSFTKRGNDVFISTSGAFIDTLGVATKIANTTSFKEKNSVKLVNTVFKNTEYSFDRDFKKSVFSEVDTTKTTVLGELLIRNQNDSIVSQEANFIKVAYGKGNFFIHTFPEAFTNYNMLLDDNNQYVASVLSYLDDEKSILWDAYYKTGKSKITSPMHYILSSKYLKWAYYTALIGLLFFILFKGKRNQRYVPIITPLKNQTLAFTQTIANMYYEKSEHKNIAEHKINYFLQYIRTQYRISTVRIDSEFYKKLANRSGNQVEDVESLFKKITTIQQQQSIAQTALTELNSAIEQFKKI